MLTLPQLIIGLIAVFLICLTLYALYGIFKEVHNFGIKINRIREDAIAAKTRKELADIYNERFIPLAKTSFHHTLTSHLREVNTLIRVKYDNMPEDVVDGYDIEYNMIKKHYGDKVAKRSQVPLMNHIDEGIAILKEIGASNDAIAAYCLHPILQSDEALSNNIYLLNNYNNNFRLILTMEYRRVANNYLSKRIINSLDDIELSQLHEVNQMLWADKLQNQKDFRLYHLGKHERSEILEQYFINWINKLKPIITK